MRAAPLRGGALAPRLGGSSNSNRCRARTSSRQRPGHVRRRARCGGYHVDSDSFGGLSPERKASGALTTLLTFAAAKIILAQVEGSGRGGLAAFNRGTYDSLAQMLEPDALKLLQRDPDAWCLELMNLDQLAGVRVLETRAAYAQDGFEWEQLQSLTNEGIKKANESIMRTHASAAFQAGLDSL